MSTNPHTVHPLLPYRARVNTREFLNLPGWHGGAFIQAYVEDTSEREIDHEAYAANFEPRTILEIGDCTKSVTFEFDTDSPKGRINSLYKIDTLIEALSKMRAGIAAEYELFDRRAAQIEAANAVAEAEITATADEFALS